MKLKDMPKVELELLSYTDLTYMLIKENKKSLNTPTVFKEICNLLGYSEEEYTAKIGDYYTSLTLDKRFVLLENGEWDIIDNHSVKLEIDEEEETEEENEEEEDLEESEIESEDIDSSLDDDLEDIDDIEDDIDELAIIPDEELDVE